MWFVLTSIILLNLALGAFLWRKRQRKNLACLLLDELRLGLPRFSVELQDEIGNIRIRNAVGTWFIHAIQLGRNVTLYILRPPEYVNKNGGVVFPESPINCVVDSPNAARRLGCDIVAAVRDSLQATHMVLSFTPCPQYS